MKKSTPKTFEDGLAQLESITEKMQHNDLPLEEAFAAYERGQELVQFCQQKLKEIEQKLYVLENNTLQELTLDDE